jgi:lipoyl(octanoyl) transferase
MDERISAFAKHLRGAAAALGAGDEVEWRAADRPVAYHEAVSAMETRAGAVRSGEAAELIWLLEHPALYTAGTSAQPSELLDADKFPVYRSGGGGRYTYHGPGQLVAYVIFDLNKRGRDVRLHVRRLEDWVIAALAAYDIAGERREGRPGIWVRQRSGDAKIAALGVRVSRWVTFHGVAINVCPDLAHFRGIVPCGIDDATVTSIEAIEAERSRDPLTSA